MPTGKCGLCHEEKELLDSHLMPKAIYKLATAQSKAEGHANTNPVVVSPTSMIQTSKQISGYFLCGGCEDILNKGGEKWVMRNCWRSESDFPIHAALMHETPVYVASGGLRRYAGKSVAGLDVSQLVHFASGVFWRAAARQWGKTHEDPPYKLTFGPYEGHKYT